MDMGETMGRGRGIRVTGGVLLVGMVTALSLLGCGETEHNPQAVPTEAGPALGGSTSGDSAALASGGPSRGSVASLPGGATSAGGVTNAGNAGTPADASPPIDISGRWAMFNFEDPVGVLLSESSTGTLMGRGCAVDAPRGLSDGGRELSSQGPTLCGEITGSVTGNQAAFRFSFSDYSPGTYATEVTISSDGQRMAGLFHVVGYDSSFRVSWLRVPPDQLWLVNEYQSFDPGALEGSYSLTLTSSDASADGGTEYVAGKTYNLSYRRHAIAGDLGSFWQSEASDPAAVGPLRVGPVPATAPELPTEMILDFDEQGFTRVAATTASGHTYVFAATKDAPP